MALAFHAAHPFLNPPYGRPQKESWSLTPAQCPSSIGKNAENMNTKLKEAIQSIVKRVPPRCIFDSHFVIAKLREQPSDECHRFCAGFFKTKGAHAQLSMQIRKCGVDVKRIGDAWSDTIKHKPGKCACWQLC
jgi:hypothetical protein